ncbi:hypothetical protein WN944_023238 [Citrus x changshan-huyou]|uniref:Mechanosensitive ion channel protein Msy1/2-like transmembrane domain-containing protein n=1 Tax=Citrus x changshan-huyou TaxID=2935761 RepID=A0AAP0N416_9ROSI
MEGGKDLNPVEKKGGSHHNDTVIQIAADTEEAPVSRDISETHSQSDTINTEITEEEDCSHRNQLLVAAGSASLDKPPTETAGSQGQSLTRRKPVSRFGELIDAKLVEGNTELMNSPPRAPRLVNPGRNEKKKNLTVNKLENHLIWELELWKWCVLVLVIFCGRLVTKWLMIALTCSIKRNFKLKLMVLYYVDGLRRSVRAFIWFALVLLSWCLLFDDRGVERSKVTKKIINYITRGLVACLVGTVLWMVKTYLFQLLVASRLSKRFFDQIQEAIFDEYVISTSSGPPLMEFSEIVGGMSLKNETGNQKEKEEVIHQVSGKRKKMKKISAWTMEKLINHISSTKLSIVSNELDDYENDELHGDYNKNIESEWEAKAAAYWIFRNVAQPGSKYIEEEDLLRFFIKKEVDVIMQKLDVVETGRIRRSDFSNWVVNVYKKRTSLAHYLNNSKEVMQELNKLFTGIVMVLIIIVWLLIVGLLTTKALLLILSQVVLAVFLFGNTAKNVFEAIIFLFVTHPFDVGDRCVIDGVQLPREQASALESNPQCGSEAY